MNLEDVNFIILTCRGCKKPTKLRVKMKEQPPEKCGCGKLLGTKLERERLAALIQSLSDQTNAADAFAISFSSE